MPEHAIFARLLDQAPHIECQRCRVEMTLRDLRTAPLPKHCSATYRCPQCGTELQREFVPQNT